MDEDSRFTERPLLPKIENKEKKSTHTWTGKIDYTKFSNNE